VPSNSDESRPKQRSGSEKRKRNPIIGFRASDDEVSQIEALADRAGLTVSSYVRSRALAKPTTRAVRRAPLATAQLAQLLGLIGAATSALQRMDYRLAGQSSSPSEIAGALTDVRVAASAIMQALGKRAHDY
jgi:hypothetical protein